MAAGKPANSAAFDAFRETSPTARLGGGARRIRTACQARSHIEPVSRRTDCVLGIGIRTIKHRLGQNSD
jgi:hypothetical protein